MKLPQYTKKDKVLMAILMPPCAIVMNLMVYGSRYFHSIKEFLIPTFVTLPIMMTSWMLQTSVGHYFFKRMPHVKDSFQRIITYVSINSLINALTVSLAFFVFSYFHILSYTFNMQGWLWCLLAGIICCIVIHAFYETTAFVERTTASELEAERLKKEQLQTQFNSLKGQLSPHFLFNSLNSLSSLIATHPDKAETYVEEMSRVYRYLLRSNEEQLFTLQKEIEFIESYNHLLKTRFGNGFIPEIKVHENMKAYLLPPMTLQLLVENAVKHNIADPDTPLHLKIYTADEKLIVSNNLQKKMKSVNSEGVGLSNIISKYKLLGQPDVEIKETAATFTVTLPLIKNNG